jgi:cysteinyl-tRNA synthetase
MRKYTMDDILVRVLRHNGFIVQHVMNVTDVGHLVSDADEGEDKMEKGARQTGKSVWEVAEFFEKGFWSDLHLMNVVRPDDVPHATQYIAEQIAQVQALEQKGFTYAIPNDGIYFDTSKDPHYGELARLQLDQQKEGARIGVVGGKRHPSDFALWKFSPTDQQRQMEWDSPWGVGFPGWHIECSAMSLQCVHADQLDIHTGGIDHIPVHHTNEIAQAENATGVRPFVRYWVHHNFLRVDGQKMSKSLKNFYRLEDIIAQGYSPMALKLLFLSAHYRDELNFTWDSLAASQKGWEKLERKVQAWLTAAGYAQLADVPAAVTTELSAEAQQLWQQFQDQLNNDLHTAQALATLWKALKSAAPDALVVVAAMLQLLGLAIEENK